MNPSVTAITSELRRWWKQLLAIAVLAMIVAVSLLVYQHTLAYWHRLDSAASQFALPDQFERIGLFREGSSFCVVSCSPARVTVVYRTRLTSTEACETLDTEIERRIAPTERRRFLGWCRIDAPLPSVGNRAYVQPGADSVEHLQKGGPSWSRELDFARSGTIAWVEFNSGLD